MTAEPDAVEPSADDLSIISDVFAAGPPTESETGEDAHPEPGAAMFYTQGGSPC